MVEGIDVFDVAEEALRRAGRDWDDLDAVAVTRGPGLAPALLVGLNFAKGLAFARGVSRGMKMWASIPARAA